MAKHTFLSIVLIGLIVLGVACTTDVPSQPIPTATLSEATPGEAAPTNASANSEVSATPTLPATVTQTSVPVATLTPTNTAPPTATKRPTALATRKPISSGPLAFTYDIIGIRRLPDNSAILTLRVNATGGSGRYTYYHDDSKQTGPTFDVPGHCGKPFVHTLKVTSTDGQGVAQTYFINGVCPTPTPTPKS